MDDKIYLEDLIFIEEGGRRTIAEQLTEGTLGIDSLIERMIELRETRKEIARLEGREWMGRKGEWKLIEE